MLGQVLSKNIFLCLRGSQVPRHRPIFFEIPIGRVRVEEGGSDVPNFRAHCLKAPKNRDQMCLNFGISAQEH